jgi:hypothetical protein
MARNWRAPPLAFCLREDQFTQSGISGELSLWSEFAVPGGASDLLFTRDSKLGHVTSGQFAGGAAAEQGQHAIKLLAQDR